MTLCFFGDGGINKGTFHEAMNFAGIRRLPVVFLCENNQFAQYTAVEPDDGGRRPRGARRRLRHSRASRSTATTCSPSTRRPRRRSTAPARGEGPSLIIADTYRFYGHNVGEPSLPQQGRGRGAPEGRPDRRYEAWLAASGKLDADGA